MQKFDFEEERVRQEILELGAKRVLIQLPEGLKSEAPRLANNIEKLGVLPIVSVDPCYGACDLATIEAENLDVNLVIHYGHSKLLKYERVPTIYIETRATLNVDAVVTKALPMLETWQKIGLTTTVQHIQNLESVKDILLRSGKTVIIGDAGRLNYPGQVIGCEYGNATSIKKDVDAFLFVGGGVFHALGVALSTSKPTIICDPYEQRSYFVDEIAVKTVKQRWANIEEAKQAKTFAVLVGLKPGQKKFEDALMLKQKLENEKKTAYIFSARNVTPELLLAFPTIDAYVNTACPRISLENAAKFHKPVLTTNEALVVAGALSWEELCQKGLFVS